MATVAPLNNQNYIVGAPVTRGGRTAAWAPELLARIIYWIR